MSLAFFCAVCNVMGIRIALRFGRNTSLLIARAKANLLRQGKNPDGSLISSIRPPPCSNFLVSSVSDSEGHCHPPSLGIKVVSSLGLWPEGWFVYSLCAWVVRRSFLGNNIGYARVVCKGDKVLCAFLRLSGSRVGVEWGSRTFYRSP